MTKYLAFVRLGVLRALSERGELYGRSLFAPMILGVFTALWRAVGESGMPSDAPPHRLVWYLAATEWITLSVPLVHTSVQEDVRRGDIAVQLPRPVSYVGAVMSQALGLLLVRASVLGVVLYVCAIAFTGRLPPMAAIAYVVPFGLAAQALLTSCFVLMGILAFWLDEVTPLHWVWQKSMFVLGGLSLPLEIYPSWLVEIGSFTPFPWLLAGPATFMLKGPSADHATQLGWHLVFWFAVTLWSLQWLFSLATRRLQVNGG
ncbi:MAG: ABC-2 family transporter protein [Polyangiales bacterium]